MRKRLIVWWGVLTKREKSQLHEWNPMSWHDLCWLIINSSSPTHMSVCVVSCHFIIRSFLLHTIRLTDWWSQSNRVELETLRRCCSCSLAASLLGSIKLHHFHNLSASPLLSSPLTSSRSHLIGSDSPSSWQVNKWWLLWLCEPVNEW